jgi:hypothetical protein
MGNRLAYGDQHASHIHPESLFEGVVVEFDQRRQSAQARAVDQDVQAIELLDDKTNGIGGSAFLSDVCGDVANRVRVFAGELLERLFPTAGDDHPGSFGDQSFGYRSTNAGSSTGDECNFVSET